MNRIKKFTSTLEKLFQAYLGRFPVFYYPAYRLLKGQGPQVVSPKTDLVIESFPRCGNSFAVVLLKRSQKTPISVASHLHVVAQIVRAQKMNKPLILLTRDPVPAVASLMLRDSIGARLALRYYINYYRAALKFIKYPVVADLSEIECSYPRIIQSVNERFGTSFQLPQLSDEYNNFIFETIDSNYRAVTHSEDVSLSTSSPNPHKEKHKKAIENSLKQEHPQLLAEAYTIYKQVLTHRQECWP